MFERENKIIHLQNCWIYFAINLHFGYALTMHTWLQWAPIISDQELLHLDIYNWKENLSKFSFWNLQVLILPKLSSIISLYNFYVFICLAYNGCTWVSSHTYRLRSFLFYMNKSFHNSKAHCFVTHTQKAILTTKYVLEL